MIGKKHERRRLNMTGEKGERNEDETRNKD